MASKTSTIIMPHLGFSACIKSLENLMKEAIRYGLEANDAKKVLAVWNDDDGNEIQITNEKAFQTYLKMPQKKLIIKRDEEVALKIAFQLKGRKQIVYSFATTYCGLLEDLDGSFGIRFPNDDHQIYWNDNEGDSFDLTNEKSFELFLKYGSKELEVMCISKAISRKNDPMKILLTKQSTLRKQYIDAVQDWASLLKELELTFGLKFSSQEYRLYWKDEENDELEITDDSSFHIFIEKTNSHRIFIVEKPKPPTLKVYFMRVGDKTHKVCYWNVSNYVHFLAMVKKNLSVDPEQYRVFDGDDDAVEAEEEFDAVLSKATEKKKLFIEPRDDQNRSQLPLAITQR